MGVFGNKECEGTIQLEHFITNLKHKFETIVFQR